MFAIFDRRDGGYLRLVSRARTVLAAMNDLRRQVLLETDGLVVVDVGLDAYEVVAVDADDVAALDAAGPGRAREALAWRGRRPL